MKKKRFKNTGKDVVMIMQIKVTINIKFNIDTQSSHIVAEVHYLVHRNGQELRYERRMGVIQSRCNTSRKLYIPNGGVTSKPVYVFYFIFICTTKQSQLK